MSSTRRMMTLPALCLFLGCWSTEGQNVTTAASSGAVLAVAGVSSSVSDLPDAPQAAGQASKPSAAKEEKTDRAIANRAAVADHQDVQTKRILGVIPNFRAVSADVELPPQSVKEKFLTTTQDSFDYSTILLPALIAGYSQASNSDPDFHQGAVGYGRYFWHSYVDQASENYFVEFIVPAITHQDTRYYTLGKGGFTKRAVYSLTRAVITRNDAGREVFNTSEVAGAAASAALSNLYYPSRDRTLGGTLSKWGQNVGIDGFTFMTKEFWPDINHYLFHGKGGS